jgi:hypothetical protein
VHCIFKADGGAARNEVETTSAVADCNELKFVAPRVWVGKAKPRLSESSFDLHHGLDVGGEIDTVPAELLNDLFKLETLGGESGMGNAKGVCASPVA